MKKIISLNQKVSATFSLVCLLLMAFSCDAFSYRTDGFSRTATSHPGSRKLTDMRFTADNRPTQPNLNLSDTGSLPVNFILAQGSPIKYVAIGNSLTEGLGDDDPSDDVSMDGRNSGGGFEPILNNLLSNDSGLAHSVVNEGVEGTVSAEGLELISAEGPDSILSRHHDAKGFLIQYGTNDARPWLPVPPTGPGSFQDNMQQIIDKVKAAGKEAWVAKPPIALARSNSSPPYNDPDSGARNVLIKDYIDIIDHGLNNISLPSPDFYSYFSSRDPITGNYRYQDQYADNLHPNGEGYRSMAKLWFEALSQSPYPRVPPNPPINLRITWVLSADGRNSGGGHYPNRNADDLHPKGGGYRSMADLRFMALTQ